MLLLGFFLLPMVLVTGRELRINNYNVKIEDSILTNVEPIGKPSDELDFSGLGLSSISGEAFQNVTNLTALNLANNSLTNLSSEWLKLLGNLKNLSVANNRIKEMPIASVSFNTLETVDLSNNPTLVLASIGNFGSGRCDFIVKGTRTIFVSYGLFTPVIPVVTTANPPISVVMDMFMNCKNWPSYLEVEADNNENITLADQKIKCPKMQKPSSITFDITHTPDTNATLEVCIKNGTLQRLSILLTGSAASKNCKDVLYHSETTKLELSRMGIENFAKGWYHAGSIPIHWIDLADNNITELTSNLLNDLPESVEHVRLSGNKIEHLDAGIIQNEFLMYLDLSDNGLHEIQSNALEKTNLLGLVLSRNNLTDTRFVEKLPSSLTELYLDENDITQVSDNSFSKLNDLFYLDLSSNKITQLGRQSLQGLSSLQRLFLSGNGLRNIESGAFRDLRELRELNLDNNNMTELKESVFSDLRELIFLYLNHNNLKKITKDTFKGLPGNLRTLKLENNDIESLEKGSFVKVPKYLLDLDNNIISKIEKGAINISSLRDLLLSFNKLSEIKEENFDLPNLNYLKLNNNLIGKIEKGAFRNLGKLYHLSIDENPIKTLQKGSLFGIKLTGLVITDLTNLELIEGGAFFDE